MARVLIVEDDAEQLMLRVLLLRGAGHEIFTASSAPEALRSIADLKPAILLMDLRLPQLSDGLALIRSAAAAASPPRIVVLSGWPQELEERPESSLVSRILMKPAPLTALMDAIRQFAVVLLVFLVGVAGAAAQQYRFEVARSAEVVAEMEMSSPGADWGTPGREAALAVLSLDGRAESHVMLWAGSDRYTYRSFLGELEPGAHVLRIARHKEYSAPGAGLEVSAVRFREVMRGDPEWDVLAHAPILHARADTVGGFSDVPLLAYCERLHDAGRRVLQYTVIFSNEDGGTSTRGLMARWGRTTDIEYIYRVSVGPKSEAESATIQGEDHKEIAFRGRREGAHPVLIPVTLNNMVGAEGASPIRYRIPPELVDLSGHSREEVMDRHAIAYRVAARELEREGKLRPFGTVDGEKVGDPRQYAVVEMKVANHDSAIAILLKLHGETVWRSSHLGRADYAIERDGWARATVELPPGTRADQIEEAGFMCVVPKPEVRAGVCRVEAVSKMFLLRADYTPASSFFRLDTPLDIPTGVIEESPLRAPANAR